MDLAKTKASTWSLITVFGVVLYVAIDVWLAYLRSGYSLLHNAESDYGRGPYFWVMDINFLIRCALSLSLVMALLRAYPKNRSVKRSSYWLITWAIASGLLAFFADNPYGYKQLASGSVHLLLAFIAFVAVTIAMIVFDRLLSTLGLSRLASFGLIALTVVGVLAILLLGHARIRPHSLGGLYERIFLGAVVLWELILALAIFRRKANSGG